MWKTRDGYAAIIPPFRTRRLQRRLRTQYRTDLQARALARTLKGLFGKARRMGSIRGARASAYPVFRARLGLQPMVIVTRAIAPRRVEVLYIGRAI